MTGSSVDGAIYAGVNGLRYVAKEEGTALVRLISDIWRSIMKINGSFLLPDFCLNTASSTRRVEYGYLIVSRDWDIVKPVNAVNRDGSAL